MAILFDYLEQAVIQTIPGTKGGKTSYEDERKIDSFQVLCVKPSMSPSRKRQKSSTFQKSQVIAKHSDCAATSAAN